MVKVSRLHVDTRTFLTELWVENLSEGSGLSARVFPDSGGFLGRGLLTEIEIRLAENIGEPIVGLEYRPCRERRHKRFVKDIAAEGQHIHLGWTVKGLAGSSPTWFFALAEGYAICGFGHIRLKRSRLTNYQTLVASKAGQLQGALDAAGGTLSDYGAAPSKRVSEFSEGSHPHEGLLRRRSLIVEVDIESALKSKSANLPDVLSKTFEQFQALQRFLSENPI